MLRIKRPEADRPVPRAVRLRHSRCSASLSCLYLMVSLSVMTWVRFLGWLDIGMVIYWFYGRTHSPLADTAEAARRSGGENLANFLKVAGYLLLFNGFCITLLAFLTIWGVTTEAQAKWARARRRAELRRHAHQPGDCRRVRPEDPRRSGAIVTVAGHRARARQEVARPRQVERCAGSARSDRCGRRARLPMVGGLAAVGRPARSAWSPAARSATR